MIGRTRWAFAEVESTQDIAFQLGALGADHGTIVRAEFQRAGRGRQGRRWESPAGTALMFSILLRPQCRIDQLGHVSLQAGLALARVFERHVSKSIAIKWPNDVLIDGRKSSGVLLQTRGHALVLGIGINVLQSASDVPPDATSLSLSAGSQLDREHLFEEIIAELDASITLDGASLSSDQHRAIESRLWFRDQTVTLLDADREIRGQIQGIARTGELRILQHGVVRMISSGEITRGPRSE